MDTLCEKRVDSLSERFHFLKRINPTLLTLYPLQLANVERLEKNDVVFVFDEVGCGKTISSGLMALSYLEQCEDKKVLVITINSLVKTEQFKNDWFNRLPFTEEQKERITVINDHVKRIEEKGKEKWGLIIVDEAQLFLSDKKTGKGEALKQLNGEKVVFLTATPIRKNEKDLEEYVEISSSILKKEHVKIRNEVCQKKVWQKRICEELSEVIKGKEKTKDNICAIFEPSCPITRYFKDTVRFLEKPNNEFESKKGSKRRFALIWKIGDNETKSKEECLLGHIQDILKKDSEHHFVVFATKQQAKALGEYFGKAGFRDYYSCSLNDSDKTYRVITGDNSEELGDFGKKNSAKNPTVLFVNYQVAEQGLNLPDFDYVVNYQISCFPSRLEQRFGRIDRLDKNGESKYDTINICYVLSNTLFDTSTWNFYMAMNAYIESILPFLPSRNMILNEEILSELENVSEATIERLEVMLEKLKDEGKNGLTEEEKDFIAKNRKMPDKEDDENEDEESDIAENDTDIEIINGWIKRIKENRSNQAIQVKFAKEAGIIRETSFSDEIFVRYGDEKKTKTLTNKDCENAIWGGDEYKRYFLLISSLSSIHKVKEMHERNVTHAINSYLIMAFVLGDLNALYPLDGYKRQMKRILQIHANEYSEMIDRICRDKDTTKEENNSRRIRFRYAQRALLYSRQKWEETEIKMGWTPVLGLSEEDKEFLIENAEEFLLKLPIYQYLRDVGRALFIYNGTVCTNGNLDRHWWSKDYYSWCHYLGETFDDNSGYWRFYIEGENGWEPSPFLKLFYHYERCESPFLLEVYRKYPKGNGIIKLCYDREQECKDLLETFLDYSEINDYDIKEAKKKEIEERLLIIQSLNNQVADYYKEKGTKRCVTSWYGNIFNFIVDDDRLGKYVEKRHNWRIKERGSGWWYSNNDNGLKDVWLGDLLRKDTFKKKLDYWSYNLIQEMLLPDYINRNQNIQNIYMGNNPECGFDLDAIGLKREILCGAHHALAKRVLSAISPWLCGERVPEAIRKLVQ